ncbi:MAG: helix-hairpin-helix domain-containing protein, partial [Bacteroidia bacterium]|nr:helix-hairpin-helix domain-containing protein [Bacteroidia bacterium]
AQTDVGEKSNLNDILEQSINDNDDNSAVDYEQLTLLLIDLQKNPTNLNEVDENILLQLPGMNSILVNNLRKYIQQNGKLTSIFELQAVPGYDLEVISRIQPYVTVKESSIFDINPDQKAFSRPNIRNIPKDLHYEIMARSIRILEKQEGYIRTSGNRYLGDPWRQYFRFRGMYRNNLAFGIVLEKDAGEQMIWQPQNKIYGADFISAHFHIRDFGRIKALSIGDYTLNIGQGLVFWNGLAFGKGVETINVVKRNGRGILPYRSVNEYMFARGVATTVAITKPIEITAFYSNRNLDASVALTDTLNEEILAFSTINISGLHRTPNEISKKNNVKEQMFGGRMSYQKYNFKAGCTAYYQEFNKPFVVPASGYRRYEFADKTNAVFGADYDYTVENVNFFGEVAMSKNQKPALIQGALMSLDPKVDAAILLRYLDKSFHNTNGNVFAERRFDLNNEIGLYTGIKIKLNSKWLLSSYYDKFWFPQWRYDVSMPSEGSRFLAQIDFSPSRQNVTSLRYRHNFKQKNADNLIPNQNLKYLNDFYTQYLRLDNRILLTQTLESHTRIELCWYKDDAPKIHTGLLILQDVNFKILKNRLEFTGRYAIFDSRNYQARIYAYENDLLGLYTIPAYSGVGTRTYFMLRWAITKDIDFWIRYSNTLYVDRQTVGSYLDESQGSRRSDIK